MNLYLTAAKRRADQAFRPATQRNHRYVMKLFVGFALSLRADYRQPKLALVLAFLEYLARTQKTAAAVVSTFTTLRALLARNGIPVHNFNHSQVDLMIRAIKINKRTLAVQRPPVITRHLRLIIARIRAQDYGQHMAVAILMMFTTNFRQSNVLPQSIRRFDETRHLTRGDIKILPGVVKIAQKWSKTTQQAGFNRWISIPRAASPYLCLHTALRVLYRIAPTTTSTQPLLTFEDGNPLTTTYVSKAFKQAIKAVGLTAPNYTLHSLRRGGARYLQQAGVEAPAIAAHGGWRSGAILRYIKDPHRHAAFKALQCLE